MNVRWLLLSSLMGTGAGLGLAYAALGRPLYKIGLILCVQLAIHTYNAETLSNAGLWLAATLYLAAVVFTGVTGHPELALVLGAACVYMLSVTYAFRKDSNAS